MLSKVALEPAFGDQAFDGPVEIALGPSNRLYVLEQKGLVRVVERGGAPATTALDISASIVSGGEAGLLGIAFDPAFSENGFVYLYVTEPLAEPHPGISFDAVVARFESKDGGLTIDPSTMKRLLVVPHPFTNHNGGKLAFGPDGFLYVGIGDGGSSGDPQGNAQNRDVLLGKILRIDPNGGDPYAIPRGNPFAAGGGRPEIWAYGLRNPWKFSFDSVTGELFCGDVGEKRFEEIDRIDRGANYGWNVREASHCYAQETCPTAGFTEPLVEYPRSEGLSVIAGYVYRGTKIPSLVGKFVYGDFGSGRIWSMGRDPVAATVIAETDLKISSFARDENGELYVADYPTGKIKALVASSEVAPPSVGLDASAGDGGLTTTGTLLSDTGCLDPTSPTTAPRGAIGYTVNSPLWSDGASKDRWVFVPRDSKITVTDDGDFDLPPGSIAVKTFAVAGRRVETRLLVRYDDGGWAGYSYEWNDEQTNAVLLGDGKTKALPNGQSWTYPSRAECFACHTSVAGYSLGLEGRQLDRVEDGESQLAKFSAWLDAPIEARRFPALAAADAPDRSVEDRARGYLHANCSICHREGSGSGAATFDVRADRPLTMMRVCNVVPQAGDLGVADAKLFAPGDPARSMLARRTRALDDSRMPPLATHVIDETGAAAVEAWIQATDGCP